MTPVATCTYDIKNLIRLIDLTPMPKQRMGSPMLENTFLVASISAGFYSRADQQETEQVKGTLVLKL